MADEQKTIAVVGATGTQGGGLARAILDDDDSPFEVRAITRSPDSEPARALARQGAEVVRADLNDPDTVVYTAYYWDNLIHFGGGPRRGEDGVLRFVLPMDDARLPGIAGEDIGRCAYGIFREGQGPGGPATATRQRSPCSRPERALCDGVRGWPGEPAIPILIRRFHRPEHRSRTTTPPRELHDS